VNKPTIFRYELAIVDSQELTLPRRARILSVAPGRAGYYIDLWALLVSDVMAPVAQTFRVFGTGHPLPDFVGGFGYVGTVVMPDQLVWHVFTEGNPL
jgi:hypothetical protein